MKNSIFQLCLLVLFHIHGSLALAAVVQADSFESILQMSLQKYQNNIQALVQNSLVRLPKNSILLKSPELIADCTSQLQGISMQAANKGQTIRQVFKFTDCRGAEANLSISRSGTGLQAISLNQFLEGDWGFEESLDFWRVDLNWQNVRLSSQKKNGVRKSVISLDGLNIPDVPLNYVDLQIIESHEKKSGVETDSKQYSIRESPSAMFENYTVTTQKVDGQIFSIEKYELDHGVITPKVFADFYQPRIVEGVIKALSETLAKIPLQMNGP
jgi:hypothetical protein